MQQVFYIANYKSMNKVFFLCVEIECPPAPTTGTYERLSQPPSEDNYAVPPELGMWCYINS